MNSRHDLKLEKPKDQEWVSNKHLEAALFADGLTFPEAVMLTKCPKFHWFGYYDKFATDPTGRFVLGMEVGFDSHSPRPKDIIKIGIVDRDNNNAWVELDKSFAWSWQQGCMLQWRPASDSEVVWNDRIKDKYVCHILNIETGHKRTLEMPIYHISPSGKKAVSLDFSRIQSVRPGYGYAGIKDLTEGVLRPENSGVWLVDLDTAETKFLFSIAEVAAIAYDNQLPEDEIHWFNHAAWNTDGSRFLFLHRWRSLSGRFRDFRTRMFTASPDGDLRLVTDKPYVSHFIWKDPEHIAMWREDGYKLYKDDGNRREEVIFYATNGHNTYLPDNNWILTDTYLDKNSYQHLYLYHTPTKRVVPIGRFLNKGYKTGELRCDLHPRLSRDGHTVLIDSTHGGNGRQIYAIDIQQLNVLPRAARNQKS